MSLELVSCLGGSVVVLDGIRNVFRGAGKNFSSSAKVAALLHLHHFSKWKTLPCNAGWLVPLFSPFPSPGSIPLPISKEDSSLFRSHLWVSLKEEATQRSHSSKQHLCRVYYFKESLNLHLVFKSKLYIFVGEKQLWSNALGACGIRLTYAKRTQLQKLNYFSLDWEQIYRNGYKSQIWLLIKPDFLIKSSIV